MVMSAAATAARIIIADIDRSKESMIPVEDKTESCFVMPDDVTVVTDGAFAGRRDLTHIDLRNVRYIGAKAFQDCANLESVEMDSVTVIGAGAFEFCRSLRSISIGSVTEIGEMAFMHCRMLDIPEMPHSLVSLGAAAFSHTAVRKADLHWMTTIPRALFSCCTSLSYADISGACEIGEDAFAGCSSLSLVKMGAAERIGHRAFYKCGSFIPGKLPDRLQYIGDEAFCCVRDGVVVPESVREFGKNCFGPVDKKKSIRIHASSLYSFRNYFGDEYSRPDEEEEHFHLWESSADVTVLDHTGEMVGFMPLYSDLDNELLRALKGAFREDNTFDYLVIDTVLFEGMSWNQRAKDRLAVMRLKYPFELSESARSKYTGYLCRHLKRIAQRAVKSRDIDMLSFLYDKCMICSENILEILDYSISLSASECTAFLLKCRAELDGHKAMVPDEL